MGTSERNEVAADARKCVSSFVKALKALRVRLECMDEFYREFYTILLACLFDTKKNHLVLLKSLGGRYLHYSSY